MSLRTLILLVVVSGPLLTTPAVAQQASSSGSPAGPSASERAARTVTRPLEDVPAILKKAKPGDWAKYETEFVSFHSAGPRKRETNMTLTRVGKRSVTLQTNEKFPESGASGDGLEVIEFQKPYTLQEQMGFGNKQSITIVKGVSNGEVVKVGEKEFQTTRTDYLVTRNEMTDERVTLWTSPEAPLLGVVKMERRNPVREQGYVETKTLVAFGSRPLAAVRTPPVGQRKTPEASALASDQPPAPIPHATTPKAVAPDKEKLVRRARAKEIAENYLRACQEGLPDRTRLRKEFMSLGPDGLLQVLEIAASNEGSVAAAGAIFVNDGGVERRADGKRYSPGGMAALWSGLDSSNKRTRMSCIGDMQPNMLPPNELGPVIDEIRRLSLYDAEAEVKERATNHLTGMAFAIGVKLISFENLYKVDPDFSLLVRIGPAARPALEKLRDAGIEMLLAIASNAELRTLEAVSGALGGGGETKAEKWAKSLLAGAKAGIKQIESAPAPRKRIQPGDIALAAKEGDIEDVVAAWKLDNRVDVRGVDGLSPLCQAAALDKLDVAMFLVSKGAKVNYAAKDGRTPLHVAAQQGSPAMCQFLLRHGADHRLRSAAGETPLDLLRHRKVVPPGAKDADFPQIVVAQMEKAVGKLVRETEGLSFTAISATKIRKALIADHQRDQARMLALYNIYGTTVTHRTDTTSTYYSLYSSYRPEQLPRWLSVERAYSPATTTEIERIDGGRIPKEFTEDLELPLPPELAQTYRCGNFAVYVAELAFGTTDPRYADVLDSVQEIFDRMTVALGAGAG